ncbi:CHC2 zinc finger domain-containing protein [Longimycelium tulufanense]|uniref:CHC2 zinc finger domain-containing protein n=1 Tax=Longimycelium tulufanense TaxID=907463 RepID=UPI0035709768
MVRDALIVKVLQRYYPHWVPPEERGEWTACLCPVHNEHRPSASVSYRRNAFKCHGCGARGDAISIIRKQEGMSYTEAVRYAAELSQGSDPPLRGSTPRKRSRRVFGDTRTASREREGSCRRLPPWRRD